MSKVLLLLHAVACFQVVRVAALNMTISPDHVRLSMDSQSVSFTCNADTALTICQFRWWDFDSKPGPLLELSQGLQSETNPYYLNNEVTGYSYSGRGLGAGDCGVTLQVKDEKTWMVACRVRAESGGWKYAWSDMHAYGFAALSYNLTTPKDAIVLPGGELRILVKAEEPLSACYFYPPSVAGKLIFDLGAAAHQSTGRHLYHGDGLQNGECGLRITNITDLDKGRVKIFIQTPTFKLDERFVMLIVARPPSEPTLYMDYTDTNVTATCVVDDCLPVANITWYLDNKVIRQDDMDDYPYTASDVWRWPWQSRSIVQTLKLELKPQDDGRVLKCVASHIALVQPLEAEETISVTIPTTTTMTTSSTPMTTVDHQV